MVFSCYICGEVLNGIIKKYNTMKRLILLIAIAGISLNLFSADNTDLRFGINLDPQLSWGTTTNDTVDPKGPNGGFNFGFFVDYFFADNYAFTTGASINNVNAKIKYIDDIKFRSTGTEHSRVDFTYKLQYVNVPLGLKFLSNQIGYMRIYANVGVVPQIRVSAKTKFDTETDIQDDIRLFNGSYYFAGGIEYSLGGSTALKGGLVYKNGMVDITDHEYPDDNLKLMNFALRLGIVF